MLILTDFGHDPDDLIAIAMLIEKGKYPDTIILSPGHKEQVGILSGFLKSYKIDCQIIRCEDKQSPNYTSGKHRAFLDESAPETPLLIDCNFECSKSLIIGPPKNLGGKLKCDSMYFQGGYSPNSLYHLEKFRGERSVQSFNPSGAKSDFNLLLESSDIESKYYIGKNVCHGYTKENLIRYWKPKNKLVGKFLDSLELTKKMHDVLAAQLYLNNDIGIWEQAKPTWDGMKLTTLPTEELIFSLIGIK